MTSTNSTYVDERAPIMQGTTTASLPFIPSIHSDTIALKASIQSIKRNVDAFACARDVMMSYEPARRAIVACCHGDANDTITTYNAMVFISHINAAIRAYINDDVCSYAIPFHSTVKSMFEWLNDNTIVINGDRRGYCSYGVTAKAPYIITDHEVHAYDALPIGSQERFTTGASVILKGALAQDYNAFISNVHERTMVHPIAGKMPSFNAVIDLLEGFMRGSNADTTALLNDAMYVKHA